MSKPKITDVTSKIVELLTPFDTIERQRIVQASFMLLGDVMISTMKQPQGGGENKGGDDEIESLPRQAKTWMKQNGVSSEMIEEVFHIADGEVDVIAASIPGKDLKAKTANVYLLKGLAKLLITGEANVDDKDARAYCKSSGCYSEANHATYMKDVGNKITGSKEKGWKLTGPGLKAAAELVKEITSPK